MNNKILLLFLVSIFWLSGCPKDDKKDIVNMKRANENFKDGDYEAALALYEELILTEGITAQIGAAWCYIRLNEITSANTYFSLAAGDSLIDGYAGWSFTSWALNDLQGAIDRAGFVIRKNPSYSFSLDSRITVNHLVWIQASSYFQLGNRTVCVDKMKLLDPSFNPDLNASNIDQIIAEKLQSLGGVHF